MSEEARWRCEKCGTLVYNALGVLKCRCTAWKAESVGQTMAADYKFGHAAGYRAGIEAAAKVADEAVRSNEEAERRVRRGSDDFPISDGPMHALVEARRLAAAIRALLPTPGAKGGRP